VRAVLVVRHVHLEAPRRDVPDASKEPLNFTVVPVDVVPSAENVPSARKGTVPLYVTPALSLPGGWHSAS